MRDRPSGAELLWECRRLMKEDLIALLPEERRYDGLLIMAALATAARELEAGEAPLRQAYDALSTLYELDAPPPADAPRLNEALLRLSARLAEDLRAGRLDADGHVHSLLTELVEARLAESNPKALRG